MLLPALVGGWGGGLPFECILPQDLLASIFAACTRITRILTLQLVSRGSAHPRAFRLLVVDARTC